MSCGGDVRAAGRWRAVGMFSVRAAGTNLLCGRAFLWEFYLVEREIICNFVGENAMFPSKVN